MSKAKPSTPESLAPGFTCLALATAILVLTAMSGAPTIPFLPLAGAGIFFGGAAMLSRMHTARTNAPGYAALPLVLIICACALAYPGHWPGTA